MAKPVVIKILGDASSLQKALGTAEMQTAGFGKKMKVAGLAAGAGLVALGGAAVGMAMDLDGAYNTIRAGTGATGEALEGLQDSFGNILGQVPDDMDTVANVMADLNTRTGQTGESLEGLSKSVLDLARLTGSDAQASVAGLTRVFGDWGVSVEDQEATLDKLFRASQSTGIGMEQLSGTIVSFGAPMRQLGFSMDESIALLSKFEKEGVNTEAVLAGMKAGLGKMAKAGEEPAETFARLQEEIAAAGTEGEAMAIAVEAFGTRAGPDLAAAIREGRFEVGELLDVVSNGDETIAGATDATQSFGDKFNILKNRVFVALIPVLERVIDGLDALFVFIDKFSADVTRIFTEWKVAEKFSETFEVIKGYVTEFVDGVLAFWELMGDDILEFLKGTFEGIKLQFEGAFKTIKGIFNVFKGIFKGDWKTFWKGIKQIFSGILTSLKGLATRAIAALKLAMAAGLKLIVPTVRQLAVNIGNAIKDKIKEKLDDAVQFFKDLPGRLRDVIPRVVSAATSVGSNIASALIDGVKAAVEGAVGLATDIAKGLGNAVIDILNGLIRTINDGIPNSISIPFAPDIPLPNNPVPELPKLRHGGPFRGAAIVGEDGPEVFRGASMGMGGTVMSSREANSSIGPRGNVTVNVYGSEATPEQIAAAVAWKIRRVG
jgi:phage-related minor tail protein